MQMAAIVFVAHFFVSCLAALVTVCGTAHWPRYLVYGERWSTHQRLSVLLVHGRGTMGLFVDMRLNVLIVVAVCADALVGWQARCVRQRC